MVSEMVPSAPTRNPFDWLVPAPFAGYGYDSAVLPAVVSTLVMAGVVTKYGLMPMGFCVVGTPCPA